MEEIEYYAGLQVKLKVNPNPVEVIYKIEDIMVYYNGVDLKVKVFLRPIQNFPLPDGGYISTNNLREESLQAITPY